MKKWSIVEQMSIIIIGIVGIAWVPFGLMGLERLTTIDLMAIIPVTIICYIVNQHAEYKYLEARKEGRP